MKFALVQSASESELAFIAALDHGQDVERHLSALHAVCFDQGGVIRPDQYWFPYEVIELGAHWLQQGHEREFAICTMLMLVNVAARTDTSTDLQSKFADRAADYDRLPGAYREEVLHGYRVAEG